MCHVPFLSNLNHELHGLVQNAPSLICTLVFDVSCRGFKLQIKLWQSNRDFCTQVHVPDLFLNPITITYQYLCFLLHTRGGGVTSPEKHKGVKKFAPTRQLRISTRCKQKKGKLKIAVICRPNCTVFEWNHGCYRW